MAEQEQHEVEPDTRARPIAEGGATGLGEYEQLMAAISAKWPEDRFTWRAHYTPAHGDRPCAGHLEVRELAGERGITGQLEAHGATPDEVYRRLRQLVEASAYGSEAAA